MDEPTNDLDIETLELLEELLAQYSGTLILVSHDRAFLDNIVTSTMVFEGKGEINEYPGGYNDWLEQRKENVEVKEKSKLDDKSNQNKKRTGNNNISKPKKLSFKEKKELLELPQLIVSLEEEQKEIFNILSDADYYKKDPKEIETTKNRSEEIERDIASAYERWNYLEQISQEV